MKAKAFIEVQFPVSKMSKESYKERKAGSGQTLTGIGKWWGRKPLVLVRAAILGLLMPASDDQKGDMEIFLKIMTMDKAGLLKRRSKSVSARESLELLTQKEQLLYFESNGGEMLPKFKKGISLEEKNVAIEKAWSRMTYDQKLTYCLRPEAIDNRDKDDWALELTHISAPMQAACKSLLTNLAKRDSVNGL